MSYYDVHGTLKITEHKENQYDVKILHVVFYNSGVLRKTYRKGFFLTFSIEPCRKNTPEAFHRLF